MDSNINIVKDDLTIYMTLTCKTKEDQEKIIKILQNVLLIENFDVKELEGAIPIERISQEASKTAEQVKFDLQNTINDIKSEIRNNIKLEIQNEILKNIKSEIKTNIKSEIEKEIHPENEKKIESEVESNINSNRTEIIEPTNSLINNKLVEEKKSFETENNIVSKPNNSVCPYCGEKLYHSRTGNGYCRKCGYNDTSYGVKMTNEMIQDLKTKKRSNTVLFTKPFGINKNHYGYFYIKNNKITIMLEKEA